MKEETKKLLDRTFWFGVNVWKFLAKLPKDNLFNIPKYQLGKASSSIGANYEEAQGAESKNDFIHKIGIVLKESRESHYWLRFLKAIYTNPSKQKTMDDFITEAEEFKKIFSTIRKNAQQGKKGKG